MDFDQELERVLLERAECGAVGELLANCGDCFVVVSSRGRCWTGSEWAQGWIDGLKFRCPGPAFELCEETAREAEAITGIHGMVCYIPAGTPPGLVLVAFPDFSEVDLRHLARRPEVC